MTATSNPPPVWQRQELWLLAGRLSLGGFFIYSGLAKALHPADFLKLLQAYDLATEPIVLNLIAATLPWFEVFCGLLSVLGVAVSGTALVSLLMLVPFTALVLDRALHLHAATGLSFCAIRFDCGCGAGEVAICHKLLENGCLCLLCLGLVFSVRSRWALRHRWVR